MGWGDQFCISMPNFVMAAAAILDFQKFKILTVSLL